MGSDVCVPLANFKLGAAASKLAGMFYSLLTMPDSADITVCTQWHLWSIWFLQAFPNTPPGMHKNRSHLRHREPGMVCPLAQLARTRSLCCNQPVSKSSVGKSRCPSSPGLLWLVQDTSHASVIRPATPSLEKLFVSSRHSLLV